MTIQEIMAIIFFIYFTLHFIGLLVIMNYGWIHHPADIRKNSNLNWFGAIFIYILWFITVPLYAIIGFVRWISAVGRKK